MPTEYFEQRERALLGQRYEQLYAALQQTAEDKETEPKVAGRAVGGQAADRERGDAHQHDGEQDHQGGPEAARQLFANGRME